MDRRLLSRLERPLLFIIIVLLVLFLETSANGCTQNEIVTSDSTKQVEKGSTEFNSEGGFLKLELIGYANAVESFDELTVSEANSKVSEREEFLLFVGRPTCEWCRRVAPSLQEVSEDLNLAIFYLDSTDTETESDLANFRDRYDIPTVPAIVLFKEDGSFTKIEINLQSENMTEELSSSLKNIA